MHRKRPQFRLVTTAALASVFAGAALAQPASPANPSTPAIPQAPAVPNSADGPGLPGAQAVPESTAGAPASGDGKAGAGVDGQVVLPLGGSTAVDTFNAMTESTLETRMGLSAADAAAVVSHRERNGSITSAAELARVDALSSEGSAAIRERVAFTAGAGSGAD